MNLFYLSKDPTECATLHCDKHVVKMIIEYAQLMSTAHRMLDGEEYEGEQNSIVEFVGGNTLTKQWKKHFTNLLISITQLQYEERV